MKGEIYNFILFSDIGTGTVANKYFFVDWNRLPESRYKLTFSFTSSTVTLSTTFEATLYISELGCCNNTVVFAPSGTSAYTAGFIGIFRDSTNSTYIQTNTKNN